MEIGLDDREWALLAPIVIETGPKRGRPPRDHRRVLDGVLWIALSGAPWRDLPARYGNWSSVYRQFLRWSRLGLLERMLAVATDEPPIVERLAAVRALSARRRSDDAAAGAERGQKVGSMPPVARKCSSQWMS